MKTIEIRYWYSNIPELNYKNGDIFPIEQQFEIIDEILSKKINLLIRHTDDGLIIYLSKTGFSQH